MVARNRKPWHAQHGERFLILFHLLSQRSLSLYP
jgi:hypothetical protein